MSRFRKSLTALGAAFGVLASSLADGEVSGQETTAIILAFVGAGLVYLIPNTDTGNGSGGG